MATPACCCVEVWHVTATYWWAGVQCSVCFVSSAGPNPRRQAEHLAVTRHQARRMDWVADARTPR
eukprot:scaffold647981_cov27-Prasinocladus_malaysianus.AAC.1